MRRVVEHKSDAEHYTADACIVWCFDNRFLELLEKVIRTHRFAHVDRIRVAGGAKGLASPGSSYEQEYVLSQIAKSLALHNPPQIILMVHSGCGDYGKKFASREEEEAFYFGELYKAEAVLSEFLKERRPEIKIVKYFADFDGVLEIS